MTRCCNEWTSKPITEKQGKSELLPALRTIYSILRRKLSDVPNSKIMDMDELAALENEIIRLEKGGGK